MYFLLSKYFFVVFANVLMRELYFNDTLSAANRSTSLAGVCVVKGGTIVTASTRHNWSFLAEGNIYINFSSQLFQRKPRHDYYLTIIIYKYVRVG